MRITQKSVLLFLLLIGNIFWLKAQQTIENTDRHFDIDNSNFSLQNSYIYTARDYVRLKDGFSFSGDINHSFHARTNKDLILPIQSDEYSNIDGYTRELSNDLVVGTTNGIFNVTSSGAATYAIPLELPQGSGGFEPQINLVYSSQAGNGTLGIGWSLSCYSAIARTGQNMYFDGKLSGVQFNQHDKFALDGNRLISINGNYGANNTEYRTEQESFQQVISHGSAGSGPMYFTVKTANGKTFEYGTTESSRVVAQGKSEIATWLLAKVSDLSGNYIEYDYESNASTGEVFIKEIRYTGNSVNNQLPYNKIRFYYSERRKSNEQVRRHVVFYSGQKHIYSTLLTKIEMQTDNTIIKKYEIKYNESQRPDAVLSELVEYGSDGKHYNSTVFNYNEYVRQISKTTVNNAFFDNSGYNIASGDFTGNGLSDLFLSCYNCTLKLAINNGNYSFTGNKVKTDIENIDKIRTGMSGVSTSFPATNIYYPAKTFVVSDFDFDGKSDIIVQNWYVDANDVLMYSFILATVKPLYGNPYYQYELIEKALIQDNIPAISEHPSVFFPIDLTNNGIPEVFLIYFDQESNNYRWRILSYDIDNNSFSTLVDMMALVQGDQIGVTDVNGNGKPELVIKSSAGPILFYEFIPATNIFSKVLQVNDENYLGKRYYSGDFNGDGNTDFFVWNNLASTFHILTSKGVMCDDASSCAQLDYGFEINTNTPFTSQQTPTHGFDYIVADFNGDGKSDIAQIFPASNGQKKIKIFYSTGYIYSPNPFTTPREFIIDADSDFNAAILVDRFGTGTKADILYKVPANNQNSFGIIELSENTTGNYLKRVTDGFNNYTNINYSSLINNNQIYEHYPIRNYPFTTINPPMFVVSEVNVSNNDMPDNLFTYNYKNAAINIEKNSFIGFQQFSTKDHTQGVASSHINNYKAEIGSYIPAEESISFFSAYKISKRTFTYDIDVVADKRYYLLLKSNSNYQYANDDTEYNLIKTTYSYNNNDLDKRQLKKIEVTVNNDEAIETTEFDLFTDCNNWWYPGWAQEKTVTKQRIDMLPVSPPEAPEAPYVLKTNYQFNTLGLLEQETAFANKTKPVVKDFQYDVFGNVTQIKLSADGMENRTTKTTYDSRGRFAKSIQNAIGHTAFFEHDNFTSLLKSETNANGLLTKYKYDGFGRLVSTELPIKEGHIVSVERNWCNPQSEFLYQITTSEPGAPYMKEYFDRLGRVRLTETEGLNGEKLLIANNYNEKGLLSESSMPYFENETPIFTTYQYDFYGRPELITSTSNTMEYDYHLHNVVSATTTDIITNDSKTTTKTYNGSGMLKSITDPANAVITYYYNRFDKTKAIDNNGVITSMTYDEYGNQEKLSDPSAGIIEYYYNAFGELINQVKPSRTTEMTYDKIGRLLTKTETEGLTVYEYDKQGFSKGKIGKIISPEGYVTNYTYNRLGQIIEVKETIDNKAFSIKYTYNDNGAVENIQYPSGFTISHDYNNNGYLTGIGDYTNVESIWHNPQANAFGQIKSYTLGNSLTTQKNYTNLGLLSRIITGNIQDFSYEFNPGTGNLTYRQDNNRLFFREDFDFDKLNQLTEIESVHLQTQTSMTYFQGNITSKSDVGEYAYDGKPYAVTSIASDPYGTEHELSETQNIIYNTAGRHESIIQGDKTYLLYYGHDNHRRKSVFIDNDLPPLTTYYFGAYELEEHDGNERHLHYIPGPDGLAAIYVIENNNPGQMYYVHTDHLGSITHITDKNAVLVDERSYDAWGRRRNPDDWTYNNVTPMLITNRGYTGHEHLEAFHLINMNARLYDPYNARMLSPDNYVQNPTTSTSFNRYSYAWNNPLVYTDPSGDFVQFIIGGVVGGFSGWMMADAMGYKGWDKFWYTLGGAAIGAVTAGIGTAVTSSAGIVAGGVAGGAVAGAGFATMEGYAAGVRDYELFDVGITGLFRGAIAGGIGSVLGGAIGGGWGAIAGGATSNLTSQLLFQPEVGIKDVNWTSVVASGASSWGLYHVSSYVNWRSNVKNQNFYGRNIKYNQYLRIQASYTRGKFWGSERAGGGFWLTKNGISRQGVSYDPEHGNVVKFDFSQKPEDAWATFHPHPYNENQVVDGNLWHSSYDLANVSKTNFSSLIVNKHGAELVTPISTNNINFWNYGKPYYIYPWFWW